MKTDVSVKRVAAFAKRLLQSTHNASPNYACAVLFMMSEVSRCVVGCKGKARCSTQGVQGRGLRRL